MNEMGKEPVAEPYLPLRDRNVVLGVSGSIAAYKAADLASKLVQAGAQVDVILTESALEFVGKATFAALTHRPVTTGLWEANSPLAIDHVSLAISADCVIVAPATANTIAKLALGLSDDALGATVLATAAPLVVAPAMDANMYASPAPTCADHTPLSSSLPQGERGKSSVEGSSSE